MTKVITDSKSKLTECSIAPIYMIFLPKNLHLKQIFTQVVS
jgi:hypothetical protein